MKKIFLCLIFTGCAGVKVINPNDTNKDTETRALDFSQGQLHIVETYICRMKSMGKTFSATAKTEASARENVISDCRSSALVTICRDDLIKCAKN